MSTIWRSAFLGAILLLAPIRADAQIADADAAVLRRAQDDFARLSAELDRVNSEVAALKRASRSVRNDYRLGERMADAEALAQKVTQAEARLRGLRGADGSSSLGRGASIATPQPLPQDGSVELEAKADLFADEAQKLVGQAHLLTSAAEQLRSRRVLRRRAGAWDRDPFSGLEASKRNVGNSPQKSTTLGLTAGTSAGDSSPRGATSPPTGVSTVVSGPAAPPSPPSPPLTIALPGPTETPAVTVAPSPESATSAKSSPLSQSAGPDRLSAEQHLFLDPATAAELRQVLGPVGFPLDPDALDRAAANLHARARALTEQARVLRAQSHAP